MEPASTTQCVTILIMAGLLLIAYMGILRPLNRKYEIAMNRLIGREIARRIYKELYPEFTYSSYHEDHFVREVVISSAVEEFRKLVGGERI